MAELSLGPDAERALQGAEALCRATNVSIIAAEHLLAAAIDMSRPDVPDLPEVGTLVSAAAGVHGTGMEQDGKQVMWGSSAREALNSTVRKLQASGVTVVSARHIALGVMSSGEVNPAFYDGLGISRAELVKRLSF